MITFLCIAIHGSGNAEFMEQRSDDNRCQKIILSRSALLNLPDDFLGELGALGRTPQVAGDRLALLDHLQK